LQWRDSGEKFFEFNGIASKRGRGGRVMIKPISAYFGANRLKIEFTDPGGAVKQTKD
jgi:hypothetical protein